MPASSPGRRALIIGGTRNLGPGIAQALVETGYAVTVFHRGLTVSDQLPHSVERLQGDRSDERALFSALDGREFDAVIDTTLYNGPDAQAAARVFAGGRIGRYVMLSTGQVYLVRTGVERPFRELDYEGPTMPAPPESAEFDYDNWSYGIHKRAAEDALRGAAAFPLTILRLPMVNSERDHFHRLRNYLARASDGHPVLIPDTGRPHLPLRHVFGPDVVRAVLRAIELGADGAFNIGQDETLTINEFLAAIGAKSVSIPAPRLWEAGLMPHCSPFSEPWMSALDNTLSKQSLGLTYTPVHKYLEALVRDHQSRPGETVPGYAERRPRELAFLATA